MAPTADISRRQTLKRALALPLMVEMTSTAANAQASAAVRGNPVLVAYFTRTGNTQLIATQITRALDATLFRIVPAAAYPEDYEEQVAQAEDERQRGFEPSLQATVQNLHTYEMVFLGFPIWGMTAPSVIRSFLSRHDLSGKTLVPFVTHGGYGLGNSLAVVAEHAPRARLLDGFSKQCDQERQTLRQVTQWLESVDFTP
jgi:flavodoxin